MPSTDIDARSTIDCMGCGYSLRGLTVDGNCPECGLPITTSIGSAFALRRRELVILACRLLAIWLIVMVASTAAQFVGQVMMFISIIRHGGSGGQGISSAAIWGWLGGQGAILVIYSLAAAALWWGAGWFGRRIFKDDRPIGIGSTDNRTAVRDDLSAVAFAAVGVYLFVSAVGPLITASLGTMPHIAANNPYDDTLAAFVDPVIRAVAGILLLIQAGTVTRLLTRLRTAGTTTQG